MACVMNSEREGDTYGRGRETLECSAKQGTIITVLRLLQK